MVCVNMAMSRLLHRFAASTSMHGIPKAIRAKSTFARVFWSIICLAATTMFCVQFTQLLQKYYSYPKKVTIEVVPLSVPFPAISVCNMRNLDIMVLNKLNRIFKENGDPLMWNNSSNDPFIKKYMIQVVKYYPLYKQKSLEIPEVFKTVLTRTTIASNIDKKVIMAAGVPFKEFIVTCRYGLHECNRTRDFTPFFDSYYYNCFTYNAPQRPGSTLAEGLENGWSTVVLTGSGMLEKNKEIRLIPGSHEWFSPMASSEGVRVVIHPPGTEPYPHTEGFDVPPSHSVSLGVKARKNIRIGLPHGMCSSVDPFGEVDLNYRVISCQKKCIQKAIVEQCRCKDIALPGHEVHKYRHVPFCNSDKDISFNCTYEPSPACLDGLLEIYKKVMCVRHTRAKMARNASEALNCGCYPPCNELSYDVTYSLSKWPAEGFDGEEAYVDIFNVEFYPGRFLGPEDAEKAELFSNYFDAMNRRKAMRDFARLNVYVADTNVLKTEELADYTQSQLLSDIGGQLGLWVGISVITLAEMLELLSEIFGYMFKKYGPYSAGTNLTRSINAKSNRSNGIIRTPVDRELEEQVVQMV